MTGIEEVVEKEVRIFGATVPTELRNPNEMAYLSRSERQAYADSADVKSRGFAGCGNQYGCGCKTK